jgi:hypothetical protein
VSVEDRTGCGDVVEDVVVGAIEEKGGEIGNDGRRISKISTLLEDPLELLYPPPKNILFVDDVDASE